MTKKKILFTILAIYFLLIFIPGTIYIYFPNLFPFIKNTKTEVQKEEPKKEATKTDTSVFADKTAYATSEPKKLVKDTTIDNTTEGQVKGSLITGKKGTLEKIDTATNELTISSQKTIINEDTLFMCYPESLKGGAKASQAFLDFRSIPLQKTTDFIKVSNNSTFTEKIEFISAKMINNPAMYAYKNNNENNLKFIIIFSDTCGKFNSLQKI